MKPLCSPPRPIPPAGPKRSTKTLGRFLRYQTTHTNTVAKRVKALEDYRKNQAAELARLQDAKRADQKLAITKVKTEILRKKNEPDCSWPQHLENMRQKATLKRTKSGE